MHLNHEHYLFPLLKSTLHCENKIFKSFYGLPLKQNCFAELSDIAFVYLLCPIKLKNSLDHIKRCKVA